MLSTIGWGFFVLVFLGVLVAVSLGLMTRYIKCPPGKILVIYGRKGKGEETRSAECIIGGARFVTPFLKAHTTMSLAPIEIFINLKNALSAQNIRISAPSKFTIGISKESGIIINAVDRLSNLSDEMIRETAENIIFGQFRDTIATMTIETINSDREVFKKKIQENIEFELNKVGLTILNANTEDISDDSGYIEQLGLKASSEVLNVAKVDVAKAERNGAIGEAQAKKEQAEGVANANRDELIAVASADSSRDISVANKVAEAEKGKAEAAAIEEEAKGKLREKKAMYEADAKKAELVKKAEAEKEGFIAQALAETERKNRDTARELANTIPIAQAEKEKTIINAQAFAEKERLSGKGEGDKIKEEKVGEAAGILAIASAEAEGILKKLTARGDGLKTIVESAGGADKAFNLMFLEIMPEMAKIQAEAISNIKIDSLTMWDNGNGANPLSSHVSNLLGIIPPLQNIAKNAGVQLPEIFGKMLDDSVVDIPKEEEIIDSKEDISDDNKKSDKLSGKMNKKEKGK